MYTHSYYKETSYLSIAGYKYTRDPIIQNTLNDLHKIKRALREAPIKQTTLNSH